MLSKFRNLIRSISRDSTTISPETDHQLQPSLIRNSMIEDDESSKEEFSSNEESTPYHQLGRSLDEEIISLESKTSLEQNISEDSLTNRITRASQDFALKINRLFYQEAASGQNVVFSPINVYTALALLHLAADGKSRDELADLLELPREADQIQNYHERLGRMLKIIQETKNITTYVVNGIFVQKEIDLIQSYKTQVNAHYESELCNVDFQNDSIKTTDYINQYISNRTKGGIPQLFTSPLPSDNRLLIAACLHFEATWHTSFRNTDTKRKYFRTSSGKTSVKMMRRCGFEWYINLPDLKLEALRLPYESGRVSIYYILPYSNHALDDLISSLNSAALQRIIEHSQQINVNIQIPRMKYIWSNDINDSLKKLGIEKIFTTDANLTNMIDDMGLTISKVTHATKIEVSENGTDISAVTAIRFRGCLPHCQKPVQFHVDRPFLFFLYHTSTRTILLMGAVRNPNLVG